MNRHPQRLTKLHISGGACNHHDDLTLGPSGSVGWFTRGVWCQYGSFLPVKNKAN